MPIRSSNKARARLGKALVVLGVLLAPVHSFGQNQEPVETIKVDSDLVDLKVSVVSLNPQKPLPELRQKDFIVLEDGQPQEIKFFATAETPFDLVLLLDLSGSTKDKLKLIRSSAKRFVEEVRPTDRVSIVSFSRTVKIAAQLTLDREQLRAAIDNIEEPEGGTNFWDALNHMLSIFRSSGSKLRRSAVVVMTDGVDNALPYVAGEGSSIDFEDLVRRLRESETIVFPIYLDTEKQELRRNRGGSSDAYVIAREQLGRLAEACGSRLYRANKLDDLDDVYKQVVTDLGRIYSVGYRPSNQTRDGQWRAVSVKIVDRQDVFARTRQGYYAKSFTN